MIVDGSVMGPGFFIFFHEDIEYSGGIDLYDDEGEDKRVYDTLPQDTIKSLTEKVEAYTQADEAITPESVENIISSLVDTWPSEDMQSKMLEFDLSQELAIIRYRRTLRQLIQDEDLAILLILVNI